MFRSLWGFFTFNVYVRFVLQTFLSIALNCASGLYYAKTDDLPRILSIVVSSIMTLFCALVIFFSTVCFCKGGRKGFEELFSDLKNKRHAKSYQIMLMIRRCLLITIIICFRFMPKIAYLSVLAGFQLIYFCYIFVVRPFTILKENVVEVFNELIFTVLVFILVFVNEKDKWNNIKESAFVYLLIMPSIFLLITSIGKYLKE